MELEFIRGVITPILAFLGASIITYLAIPTIIKVSKIKHLFDDPAEDRKLHTVHTPHLGGIAIFCAVLVTFLLSGYANAVWVPYVTAGLILLFFSGIKDDLVAISAPKKLFIQLIAVTAPILYAGCVITDIGGMFGVHDIPYLAGLILTFFTMTVVINAYNLIDGIDGLAGGIGAIVSLFMGGWFWSVGLYPEAVLSLSLFGSLVAFLWYNFEPASIFMGDTGSQVIGYLLSFLAVRMVDFGISSEMAVPFKNAIPVVILAVFIVPLYDTLRVFLMRIYKGGSPFSADRLHVHHQLIDMGFSHKSSCLIIYAYNIFILGMTLVLAEFNVNLVFGLLLLTAMVLFPTFKLKRKVLSLIGIKVPSARYINVMERKYGITNKEISHQSVFKETAEINSDELINDDLYRDIDHQEDEIREQEQQRVTS